MAFSEDTVKQVFSSAGSKCESCRKPLTWGKRGRDSSYEWEAHHINPLGGDGASNCKILCWPCHEKTF